MSSSPTKSADRLRYLIRVTGGKRLLLLEAILLTGLARSFVLLIPFKRLAPLLGKINSETAASSDSLEAAAVEAVGWAVRKASARTPWTSNCMTQAIAAKLMLRRRGITSTLYLGVSKQGSLLEAHAWLRSGGAIVTGAEGRSRFTVVSSLGDQTR